MAEDGIRRSSRTGTKVDYSEMLSSDEDAPPPAKRRQHTGPPAQELDAQHDMGDDDECAMADLEDDDDVNM